MARWTLRDPATGDVWTMPINPDSMSPVPLVSRAFRNTGGTVGDPRSRTLMGAPNPKFLEWAGVIRTQAHYDALFEWAAKPNEVLLVDHLGRYFTIVIATFSPEDRRPTRSTPWRLRYSMRAVLIGTNEILLGTAVETDLALGVTT